MYLLSVIVKAEGECWMKENVSMDKKSIKNQRVKSYFIEATKKIIHNEGVENVSVRKVADHAGYTFTTIYNYFKDLNELLQEVKKAMIQDVIVYMQRVDPHRINDLEDIKKLNHKYVKYYIENPNIFTFFYSYRLQSSTLTSDETPDFSEHYLDTYKEFVNRGIVKEDEVPVIAKTLIYTLHGLLALYFSDNGMTSDHLYAELDKTIEYLLKGRS